jgi:L-cysteine:1D-myo-inositol 2-amino-2-deoxy-alpha-D-glucopyranoside ligase
LDAPAALTAVDEWCAQQESAGGSDPAAPGLVSRAVDALLGLAL